MPTWGWIAIGVVGGLLTGGFIVMWWMGRAIAPVAEAVVGVVSAFTKR